MRQGAHCLPHELCCDQSCVISEGTISILTHFLPFVFFTKNTTPFALSHSLFSLEPGMSNGMTDAQKSCFWNEQVLDLWQGKIDITVGHNSRKHYVCNLQKDVCK